jgi:hypothetical protein
MSLVRYAAAAAAIAGFGWSAMPAFAQDSRGTAEITPDRGRITGHMTIDFNSRTERGDSGVDTYAIDNLTVADLLIYSGTIQRKPEEGMVYSLKIDVFNPQNISQIAREVAILRGEMVIDNAGRYLPAEGDLRIDIVKGQRNTSDFGGTIQGREVTRWWELGEQIERAKDEATKLYSRTVNGKVVTIQVVAPDPLKFEGLSLAAGPFSYLPVARVNGNLDYDYELGNWLTDAAGVTFQYAVGQQTLTDKVTGTIRFVEAEGNFTDPVGKPRPYTSYYEYNLRFNEPETKPEDSFFDGENSSAEIESFFSEVDQTAPGLYGRIYYYDTEDNCRRQNDSDGIPQCVGPTRSEVYYDLNAVKLTYAQLGNWFKLEPLIAGPMNDE